MDLHGITGKETKGHACVQAGRGVEASVRKARNKLPLYKLG